MKSILTLIFLGFFAISSFGQYPPDFIAPDFTATDINGEEHNLYELLDQGKTVIIDVYATWCSPCWTFHSEHVLADIWEELGPNGTDEVYIFGIESDTSTDLDQLNGIGSGTLGNWVEGTPYPLIDETEGSAGVGQIASSYQVAAYPTILFICPSRKVTSVNWQSVANSYAANIDSCPETGLSGENNISLVEYEGVEGVVCDEETFSPKITFRNIGNQNVTSANISLTMNGTTEEYEYQGNLVPYHTDEFIFPSVTSASTDIIVEVTNVNNVQDDFPQDNKLETAILVPPSTAMDTVTIEVMTDDFGADTYWAILNENGEIIGDGGNQLVGFDVNINTFGEYDPPADSTAYANSTLYTTDVYLPEDGCYTMVIKDYYFDGICCVSGDGYFKIIEQDNNVLVDGSGDFGESSEQPFSLSQSVSTSTVETTEIELFPNPVNNVLSIKTADNISSIENIIIYDLQGRALFESASFADNSISLDLSSLPKGFYILQMRFDDSTFTQKRFVKE